MAIFRKIYPRCWLSLIGLSAIEKIIALYILSGPQTNQCGLYQFSIGKAIEDIETLPQTFRKGFGRVIKYLSWEYDSKARIIYIPTWWKWNPPANPNVLIGNLKDIEELPKSRLLSKFYANTEYLSDNLVETFTQTLCQTLPQTIAETEEEEKEEEEELELEEEKYTSPSIDGREHQKITGFDQFWICYPRKIKKPDALKAWNKIVKKNTFPGLEKIIAAINHQKTWQQWATDNGKYVPYPATWLNSEGWNDQQPETIGINQRTYTNIRNAWEFANE